MLLLICLLVLLIVARASRLSYENGIGFHDALWLIRGQPGKQYPPPATKKTVYIQLPSSRVELWFYLKDYLSIDNVGLLVLSCAALKIWSDAYEIICQRMP